MKDIRSETIAPLYQQTVEAICELAAVPELRNDGPVLDALLDLLKVRSILFPLAYPELLL